jgi:RNA polymerase sigma factor (sigma-70 family)
MPAIETPEQLDAWLRRTALRTALDAARSERRRARRAESMADARPERVAEDHIDAVRRELAELDVASLELLQLRHQAGLTLDAIARRLGLSVGAVDGRLRRATRRLRRRIEEQS